MANEVSGSNRKYEYKWFQEMDEWHGSWANVKDQVPTSATWSLEEDVIPSTSTLYQTNIVITLKISKS